MDRLTWVPFAMYFYREIRRFQKVIVQTILTPFINSSLYLLIFGVSLGKNINLSNHLSYLAFIIPGLIMMGVLNNSFQNASASIVTGKSSGDLQDLRVSPLTNHQIILAIALAGLTRGIIVGLVTFIAGEIFYFFVFNSFLPILHFSIFLGFIIVGGLAFSMLGMSVAFWAKTYDQLSAVSSFILTPLIYLGGVFFTLENLHPFWQLVSQFNPLLYLINGVRYGVLGEADVAFPLAMGVSLVTLIIFYIIAQWSLTRASFTKW